MASLNDLIVDKVDKDAKPGSIVDFQEMLDRVIDEMCTPVRPTYPMFYINYKTWTHLKEEYYKDNEGRHECVCSWCTCLYDLYKRDRENEKTNSRKTI